MFFCLTTGGKVLCVWLNDVPPKSILFVRRLRTNCFYYSAPEMSCKVLFFETRIGLSRGKSAMCGGSFTLAVWHYGYVGM